MKRIKKYELNFTINIEIPKQANILSLLNVNNVPCVFVEVDEANLDNTEKRQFGVFPTDYPIDPEFFPTRVFIGSLYILNQEIHVFEIFK